LAITVRYRLDAKRLDYMREFCRAGERVYARWRACGARLFELHGARCFFGEARGVRQKAAGLIYQKLAAEELW